MGSKLFKITVIVLNVIIFSTGLALLIVGIAYPCYSNIGDSRNVKMSLYISILFAVCILIVTPFGCFAALRKNRLMLGRYSSALLLMIVLQVIFGTVACTISYSNSNKNLKLALYKGMKSNFVNYNYNPSYMTNMALHEIQSELQCCGLSGPSDYKELPASCCKPELSYCSKFTAYTMPCFEALWYHYKHASRAVGYIVLSASGFEIICALVCLRFAAALKSEEAHTKVYIL